MSTQPKHEGGAVESRNFSANSFYALTAHTRAKEEEVRGRREMTILGAREREREQPEEKEEGHCHPFFSFLVTNVGVANLQIEFTIESRGLLFQPAMPCILTYPPRLPCSPSLPFFPLSFLPPSGAAAVQVQSAQTILACFICNCQFRCSFRCFDLPPSMSGEKGTHIIGEGGAGWCGVGVGVVCSEFAARHLANKTHAMKTFFLRFVRFLSPVSVDAFASFLIQLKFKKPLIINRSKYPVNL